MAEPAKPQRGPGRPFQPGVSGNPAGTSKTPPEVRAFLASKAMAAAEALARIVEEPGHEPKVVVAAAKTLLDFAIAKPKEEKGGGDALAVLATLAAALAGRGVVLQGEAQAQLEASTADDER